MNRSRSRRQPVKDLNPDAEKFVRQAFTDSIAMKAAMLVIHRVRRSMDNPDPVRQREAMDQLMTFADAHPLPPEMEKQL